ncbi:MAG: type II toxin-antitoxin system prevent-host-death family antitoxin [Vicinamibacterales bacterium]
MKIAAAEFKARCLSVLDRVHERGESVTITKRGRVVAKLVPAGDIDEQPWRRLAGAARWHGDPLAPAVAESEVKALR